MSMTKYKKLSVFNPLKANLCEDLHIPIFTSNFEGKILYGNKAFCELFNIDSFNSLSQKYLFGKENSVKIFNVYDELHEKDKAMIEIEHINHIYEITFGKQQNFIAGAIRDITSIVKDRKRIDNYNLYLNLVRDTIITFIEMNDPEMAIKSIISDIMHYADLFYIQLFLKHKNKLKLYNSIGDAPKGFKQTEEVDIGEGVPGTSYQLNRIMLIKDISSDPRFKSTNKNKNISIIVMPIVQNNKTLGIIEFYSNRIMAPEENVIWDFIPQFSIIISQLILQIKH